MAQVFVFGRVEDDLEVKRSQKGTDYTCFRLREFLPQGRTQLYQVWAWGTDVSRLLRFQVKQGRMIWLTGSLQLVDCTVQHGQIPARLLKVALNDWGFLPTEKHVQSRGSVSTPAGDGQPPDVSAFPVEILDGDRDALPE